MIELIRTYWQGGASSPLRQYLVYRLSDGREIEIKRGGMSQTWDCQPFRQKSRLYGYDTEQEKQEIINLLKKAYPESAMMAELE